MWFVRGSYNQECHVLLAFVLSLLWHVVDCQEQTDFTIQAPKEVAAQNGLCVQFLCSFTYDHLSGNIESRSEGIWKRDGVNGVVVASKGGSPKSSNTNSRILLTGNLQKGDCSLRINNVSPKDQGHYVFRIEGTDRLKYNYRSIQPYVNVTDKPIISSVKMLISGKEATLTCTAPLSCSKTLTIEWEGNVAKKKHNLSNITFTPSERDHNSTLSCKVTYGIYKVLITSDTITLSVSYPPSMEIIISGRELISSNSVSVVEGESLTMDCHVNSNPEATIQWLKGDEVINNKSSTLSLINQLQNISLSNDGLYTCYAKNVIGNISNSLYVTVKYAPRSPEIQAKHLHGENTSKENYTIVLEGSPLSLLCSAKSNPVATFMWMKSSHNVTTNLPNGQDGFLNIISVSESDEGTYTCNANNEHGNACSSITIIMAYKPKPLLTNVSECSRKDNSIECSCFIHSFPPPQIMWKINKEYYNYSNKDLHIITLKAERVWNSTLTIQVKNEIHYTIQCIGFNIFGNFSLDLTLNAPVRQNQAIMVGAIAGTFLLVLIFLAVVFAKFIQKKKQFQKEGTTEVNPADEAIYCNTKMTTPDSDEIQMTEEEQQYEMEPTYQDLSVYMNYEDDLNYVTLDFSKMKPKDVPDEETDEEMIEYAEVKH
ncbi:LOW QUALITY PROTEIN: sialic acid-binding Ig-like lectin 16 [Bombina bombina]|uniref:LOW QUALITY PROTEIN: sialic acid-binding Ig-like lectin 16 n=1 Tax=Bombina bombina TaxID=8345 RepID=UPI00235A5E7C|nr:LOW QUALITY PROTEIN: sialic acid-binding Ig-like lectin 16 [Bombina bombina]